MLLSNFRVCQTRESFPGRREYRQDSQSLPGRPEDWLNLSLTSIGSRPIYEFRARDQEYIPFENASAGQQATALLKTLLNQPGRPSSSTNLKRTSTTR
jgi:hypothetical protein